jgi:tetratricopeptide (TPR) repeat protein
LVSIGSETKPAEVYILPHVNVRNTRNLPLTLRDLELELAASATAWGSAMPSALQSVAVLLRLLSVSGLIGFAWCQTLDEAKRAFDVGDYAQAVRLFEKAHQESPRCDTLFFAGLARYRLQQVESALIAFESAVQCDPKLIPAHLALGEAYGLRGNQAESLSAYNRVLDLDAKNNAALRGAASIYLANELNDKAVPLLEILVGADSKDPQARVDLAAAYAASGNREGAELQFREALSLKADSASALMGLANLHLKKGEEEAAIPLLKQAAKSAPKAAEPRFLLGSAYNRLGRYQEALAELEAALRLGGDASEVYYHLARTYGALDRPEERKKALARFSLLTRKAKQETESQRRGLRLVEEARGLVESGDLRGAVARMEEARELRPGDDQVLFRLASLHFDLQRYEIARNYIQEAIALAPSQWLYHYLLGLLEKNASRLDQAQSSLELAVQLNPNAAEAHNALGDVAFRKNDSRRALECFQRAAELDPQETAYKLNLEAARRAAGQP